MAIGAQIHPPTDTSPVLQVWQSYESSRRGYLPIQVATRGAALYAGGFYTRERFIATLHFGSRSCRLGISSDRQSRQAAFQLHMLYLATSNNRGRFSCVIIQANTGVVHPPSLQQPLCRAEFNTGDHQSRLGEPSSRPDHPRPFHWFGLVSESPFGGRWSRTQLEFIAFLARPSIDYRWQSS